MAPHSATIAAHAPFSKKARGSAGPPGAHTARSRSEQPHLGTQLGQVVRLVRGQIQLLQIFHRLCQGHVGRHEGFSEPRQVPEANLWLRFKSIAAAFV